MTIDIFVLAQWIGAISVVSGAVVIICKRLKVLLVIKYAVRKLYGDAFVDEAQKRLNTGYISDSDYEYLKNMHKLYVDKLGGDSNGLPKRKMDDVEELHKTGTKKSNAEPACVQKPIILAVDDSTTWTHVIKTTLSRDYDVHTSNDPKEVLSLVRQLSPDLLIIDNLMGGTKDGIELAASIKKYPSYRYTPIFMLTADNESKKEAIEVGIDEYIKKPFDKQELRETVALYLKNKGE